MRLGAVLQRAAGTHEISLQAAERCADPANARGAPLEKQQALVVQLGNDREVDYTSLVEWTTQWPVS